jgi:hypothetical protein
MADFYISAIRMDSTGQHIEWVKTHKKTSDTSLEPTGWGQFGYRELLYGKPVF